MERSDFTNMSCLVLGGGGFIGKSLIDGLIKRGASVRGFGRVGQLIHIDPDIPWVHGDFSDKNALARAVAGVDVIFHVLGGSTPESSNADPLSDLMGGPAATIALLDICRNEGIKNFIFASSGGTVYGIPSQTPISETAATEPICAYGISKLMVEKYLGLYHHLYQFNYKVLRISNCFGPHQNPHRRQGVIPAMIYRLMTGTPLEIWGDGKVVRDFIFIDDVIEAFFAAVSHRGSHRLFNIGSGIGRSISDVAADIAQMLDLPGFEPFYKLARPVDVPVNILDISLASRELGWHPHTSWPDSLRATIDWIQAFIDSR